MSINKMILVGNVGKQPEIRTTNQGKKIARFSIATSSNWKDKATGERREKTEWHNVVVFNEALAGFVEKYVSKGSKLYIEGQHQTRQYETDVGDPKYISECVLQGYGNTLLLLSKFDNSQNQEQAEEQQSSNENKFDDEIAF